jgi:plasmid maintenance system antidote protein VapI
MHGEHPGTALLRIIRDKGLTGADFEAAGIPDRFVRSLVLQECDLTGNASRYIAKIAAVTGTTGPFWEKAQANYSNTYKPRRLARRFLDPHKPSLTATGGFRKNKIK